MLRAPCLWPRASEGLRWGEAGQPGPAAACSVVPGWACVAVCYRGAGVRSDVTAEPQVTPGRLCLRFPQL